MVIIKAAKKIGSKACPMFERVWTAVLMLRLGWSSTATDPEEQP